MADGGGDFYDRGEGADRRHARRVHALRQMRRGLAEWSSRPGSIPRTRWRSSMCVLDLLDGGPGTKDSERWAQSLHQQRQVHPGVRLRRQPALHGQHGARRQHEREKTARPKPAAPRSNISTRWVAAPAPSRGCSWPPDVLERVAPALRAADEYETTPDVVFYTGCNVIKTPHIALLALEVLDDARHHLRGDGRRRGVLRHPAVQRGDAKTAGRVGFNTIDKLGAAEARRKSCRGARVALSRSAKWRCRPMRPPTARCHSNWRRWSSCSPSGSTICSRSSSTGSRSASALQERSAVPSIMMR